MKTSVCPGCGARLAPGVSQCDLCGTDVDAPDVDPLGVAPPDQAPSGPTPAVPAADKEPPTGSAELPAGSAADDDRQFCMDCGTANPAYARFCWRCGAPLAAVEDGPAPFSDAPTALRAPEQPAIATTRAADDNAAGKRAFALVGVAALTVAVLFGITQLAGDRAPVPPADGAFTAAQAPPSTVSPEIADRVAELEERVERAEDAQERRRRQHELVEFLVRAGAFARAGEVQERVAREVDDGEVWADAGSFYLAHMLRSDNAERAEFARRSAHAYEQALQRQPGDLDVKTDLATAYLNDPADPMRAVQVIREVLDARPDHARARFNYALMLAQIGRNDQAQQELERVLALTNADDLVNERAQEELERLRVGAPG